MMSERFNKENTLLQLRKMDADRVFLAIPILSFDQEKRKNILELLESSIAFFKAESFEVGVWLWTFWRADIEKMPADMPIITSFDGRIARQDDCCEPTGKINSAFFCPSSPEFIADTGKFLKEVAKLSPDIIMFDDDFRFGNLSTGFGCCCDNHLKMMSEELGETVTRENLPEKLFCGSKNRYRDAWLNSLGESLKGFAKGVREAVDSVNPNIRMAFCACMSTWDLDGVDAYTTAKILAGNTKPLLRLIGAPYWGVNQSFGQRLQGVIEQERMESAWCNDSDFEIMCEGDAYPRPRHRCPASYLEGFDTALRAAEVASGILKYTLSYTSSPHYENGYIAFHNKNKPIYEAIERLFKNKKDCGVRIYEALNKIRNADLPEDNYVGNDYIQNLFFSPAAKLLSDNTIPTTYKEENTIGIAFGENAKYIPDSALQNGLIIDIKAAKILMNKGIDVGIENIGDIIADAPILYFNEQDEYVESYYNSSSVYEVTYKPDAKVLTKCGLNNTAYTDTVFYENSNGQRFIVFSFDAYTTPKERYRSYAMQNLLFDSIALLNKPLPYICKGNPDLYTICRSDKSEIAIGLWNFFADSIEEPILELTDSFSSAEFVNCTGDLRDNKIYLSKLPAFDFAFIKLTK